LAVMSTRHKAAASSMTAVDVRAAAGAADAVVTVVGVVMEDMSVML
jgi:hypothetical protein